MARIKLTKGKRNHQPKWSGFTLLELVIVIIIIGVLTSLAIPKLFSVIESSNTAEAMAMVGHIRIGLERCYLMNNNSYDSCDAGFMGGGDGAWEQALGIENPGNAPGSHFVYAVRSEARNTYLVCSRRKTESTSDCYFLCMGLGVKPDIDNSSTSCGTSWADADPGRIYWDSETLAGGFLPKTD